LFAETITRDAFKSTLCFANTVHGKNAVKFHSSLLEAFLSFKHG